MEQKSLAACPVFPVHLKVTMREEFSEKNTNMLVIVTASNQSTREDLTRLPETLSHGILHLFIF